MSAMHDTELVKLCVYFFGPLLLLGLGLLAAIADTAFYLRVRINSRCSYCGERYAWRWARSEAKEKNEEKP